MSGSQSGLVLTQAGRLAAGEEQPGPPGQPARAVLQQSSPPSCPGLWRQELLRQQSYAIMNQHRHNYHYAIKNRLRSKAPRMGRRDGSLWHKIAGANKNLWTNES